MTLLATLEAPKVQTQARGSAGPSHLEESSNPNIDKWVFTSPARPHASHQLPVIVPWSFHPHPDLLRPAKPRNHPATPTLTYAVLAWPPTRVTSRNRHVSGAQNINHFPKVNHISLPAARSASILTLRIFNLWLWVPRIYRLSFSIE